MSHHTSSSLSSARGYTEKKTIASAHEARREEAEVIANDCDQALYGGVVAQPHVHFQDAFFDYASVEKITAIVDGILKRHAQNARPGIQQLCQVHARLDDELSESRLIGEASAAGYAIKVRLTQFMNEAFVVKSSRNPQHDELFHEFFVAKHGLNKLRRYIPSFCFAHSYFDCASPELFPSKVAKICGSSGDNASHILFEMVDGVTLRDFIMPALPNGATASEMAAMFVQVGYALEMAWRACEFRHNDLHPGNVMVRNMPHLIKTGGNHNVVIRFKTENDASVFVSAASGIATLIDFGRSGIAYHNTIVSCVEQEDPENTCSKKMADSREYGHWSFDLLRLVSACALELQHAYHDNQADVPNDVAKLFRRIARIIRVETFVQDTSIETTFSTQATGLGALARFANDVLFSRTYVGRYGPETMRTLRPNLTMTAFHKSVEQFVPIYLDTPPNDAVVLQDIMLLQDITKLHQKYTPEQLNSQLR